MTNQTEEIDECHLMPTMCNHGSCINTPGSFECMCNRGFFYDVDSHQCIDDNECLRVPSPCSGNAQCVNSPGYFECQCPDGYKLDSSTRSCIGIDWKSFFFFFFFFLKGKFSNFFWFYRHLRKLWKNVHFLEWGVQQFSREFPVRLPPGLSANTYKRCLCRYWWVRKAP